MTNHQLTAASVATVAEGVNYFPNWSFLAVKRAKTHMVFRQEACIIYHFGVWHHIPTRHLIYFWDKLFYFNTSTSLIRSTGYSEFHDQGVWNQGGKQGNGRRTRVRTNQLSRLHSHFSCSNLEHSILRRTKGCHSRIWWWRLAGS